MSYDQGYWHQEACSDKGADGSCAGTHIALYLRWCIDQGFLSEQWQMDGRDILPQVQTGAVSASKWFEERLDWKFGEWNLNQAGNEFTASYYAQYLRDLQHRMPDVLYSPESKVDYPALQAMLNERLVQFRASGAKHAPWSKPWWKLW